MSLLEVFYTFFKKKKFHILTSHVSCGLAVKKKTPINYIKIVSKQ